MRIWQVTPLSRPRMLERVREQFAKQSHPDKKICLVMNGPAASVSAPWADMVLTSEPNKSEALNAAIDSLRGEHVVVRDDDDLFTPGGLSEFAELLAKHDIVGQLRHWIWDGSYTWMVNLRCWNRFGGPKIWGGNFGFRVSDSVEPFPPLRNGQVHAWAESMESAGARVWHKSPAHGCLDRTQPDHLWRATMTTVRQRAQGPGLRIRGYRPDLIAGHGEAEFEVVERPTVEEAMESERAAWQSAYAAAKDL